MRPPDPKTPAEALRWAASHVRTSIGSKCKKAAQLEQELHAEATRLEATREVE
jgi:hypothetical protein